MITTTVARPTFLDIVTWLWRWLVDALVSLLTHPEAGRHSGHDIGGHVGASDESVAELVDLRQSGTDTDRFAPVEDVTETGFNSLAGDLAETAEFTWLDRLDADRTFVAAMRAAGEWPPDATQVALDAGARRAGGA